jgi:hypothetical protein
VIATKSYNTHGKLADVFCPNKPDARNFVLGKGYVNGNVPAVYGIQFITASIELR